MSQATTILDFWFGSPNDPNYGKQLPFWFDKQPEFDAKVRDLFLADYQKAVGGHLHDWINLPQTCLALILLLDQFPRNMFRDTPQAFATDWEALSIAKHATNKGYDRQLLPVQQWFIYLPFEHSENIEDQRKCIKLFQNLSHDPYSAKAIESAFKHKQIIARFGRFPHRNAILGRISTPDEEEFLAEEGSSF